MSHSLELGVCKKEILSVLKLIGSKINCESAIGQHLITNPECADHILTIIFGLLDKRDRHFI